MQHGNGDMWRVDYPADTGPRHTPIGHDWPPRMEEYPMVEEKDFVYVDLYGNEVSRDDPAAQTKYSAAELKALKKGGFFPKRGDDAVLDATADAAADESHPVLNSGVSAKSARATDASADDEDADAPADDGEKRSSRQVAKK